MRILILKFIKQVIYRFSEHTPPEVKFSKRNLHIACINRDIDEFIKFLKTN